MGVSSLLANPAHTTWLVAHPSKLAVVDTGKQGVELLRDSGQDRFVTLRWQGCNAVQTKPTPPSTPRGRAPLPSSGAFGSSHAWEVSHLGEPPELHYQPRCTRVEVSSLSPRAANIVQVPRQKCQSWLGRVNYNSDVRSETKFSSCSSTDAAFKCTVAIILNLTLVCTRRAVWRALFEGNDS